MPSTPGSVWTQPEPELIIVGVKRRPVPPTPVAAPEPLPAPPHVQPARVPAPPPSHRSKVWTVGVLATFLAAGVAGGFVGARMVGPGPASPAPCEDAQFVSQLFGYCMDVPAGWVASHAAEEPSGVDLFTHEATTVEVWVEAVALPEGLGLREAVEQLQAEESGAGLQVTPTRPGDLGGEPSLIWDTLDEEGRLVAREIAIEHDGALWRLQIALGEEATSKDVSQADELLVTWRFA